jgi:uncharacterized protein YbbK (DUF523 family)
VAKPSARGVRVERLGAAIAELRDLCWLPPTSRPRVLVSSCLLGEAVRFDGRDKRHDAMRSALSGFAEIVSVCPEVGSGMSVPRPPVELVVRGAATGIESVALIERDSGRDHTASMTAFAVARLRELAPLDGFVGKSGSPSCGRQGVALHATAGAPSRAPLATVPTGAGLFVRHVRRALPGLVELDERAFSGRHAAAVAARFRLACEWSLAWRTASAAWCTGAPVARFHRKLRAFWRAVEPALLLRLDRLIDRPPGAPTEDGAALAEAYSRQAKSGLRSRLRAPQRE